MGMYGYICKECGKNIRGGEIAHLIHVREGKILGECNGHYNNYGGVDEDSVFDKHDYPDSDTNINGHNEIMKSCFELPTSKKRIGEKRLFEGKGIYWDELTDILKKSLSIKESDDDYYEKTEGVWESLPVCTQDEPPTSGIVAYHARCYHALERKNQVSLSPSESDPDQSCGRPRREFCCKRDLVMLDNKKE